MFLQIAFRGFRETRLRTAFFRPRVLPNLLATLHQVNLPLFPFVPPLLVHHRISSLSTTLEKRLEVLLSKSLPVNLYCTYDISVHQTVHCFIASSSAFPFFPVRVSGRLSRISWSLEYLSIITVLTLPTLYSSKKDVKGQL